MSELDEYIYRRRYIYIYVGMVGGIDIVLDGELLGRATDCLCRKLIFVVFFFFFFCFLL